MKICIFFICKIFCIFRNKITKYGENIFENLVNHIQLFFNEKYQIQKSKDEIEKVLLIFLQKYQHDLLNGYLDPNLIKIDIDEDHIISRKSGQKIQKIANLQYYKSKANYGTKKKGISR